VLKEVILIDLAQNLLIIRKKMGLNQTEMAKKFGIAQRTWSSYETGRSKPTMEILFKLAEEGYTIQGLSDGSANKVLKEQEEETGLPKEEIIKRAFDQRKIFDKETPIDELPSVDYSKDSVDNSFDLFRFKKGMSVPVEATETDTDALVMLPMYSQTASAGPGQTETQLAELEKYIPVVLEMLGGANPKNCGMVRVVGDSMTDMSLFNGDWAIFDRTQVEGDGVYVISIGTDVRVKRLEYRPIEKKIIISSENAKRYPNPEIIRYEQAENLLSIHGKLICWMHRHPY